MGEDTLTNTSSGSILETSLGIAIIIIGIFIVLLALAAAVISIILAIKYLKFNRKMTKANVAGKDVARDLLDKNGLEKIKVKRASLLMAFMVGNSYSHYFHRIRLRGLVYNKPSITSVAIAGQKVGLALLDKEKDPDMVKRIKLVPIVTFGPFMFIPLVLVGLLLDIFLFNSENGIATIICSVFGLLFYVWAFVLTWKQLVTEKKAQARGIALLTENNYLTEEEVEDAKELFKLYNINYILNMIIALLQLIKEVLRIALKIASSAKKSN